MHPRHGPNEVERAHAASRKVYLWLDHAMTFAPYAEVKDALATVHSDVAGGISLHDAVRHEWTTRGWLSEDGVLAVWPI